MLDNSTIGQVKKSMCVLNFVEQPDRNRPVLSLGFLKRFHFWVRSARSQARSV